MEKNGIKRKWKRKCAFFLFLVMLGTALCGSSVCAEEYFNSNSGERRLMVSHRPVYVLPGDQVTLTATIPEEYKGAYLGFEGWLALKDPTASGGSGWRNVDIGLSEEELAQMTITFTMPDEDFWIDYRYTIDTVSGNAFRYGYFPVDTSYLKPGSKPDEEIIDIIAGPASGNSGSSDSPQEETPAQIENVVKAPDGTALSPSVDVVYVAESIAGAMPTGEREAIERAAGLSAQDILDGTKTKFYIGDVYKAGVKTSLRNMFGWGEYRDHIIGMIDMDLYTIGKEGINAVRFPAQPVEMILSIPPSQVMEGRSYSLAYILDGKAVEIEDKDDNPGTITIDAPYFGPYVLIWK